MTIRQNVTLAPYTTFGIGGPADYFTEAYSVEEVIEAVLFAESKAIPFFIIGTGANILVGDKGFRGVVIKNEARQISISSEALSVKAESGATIEEFIAFTTEKGLSGFEHFAGIPSSIGGALWQNLHFLSPDRSKTVFIGDSLESAVIYSSSEQSEHRSQGDGNSGQARTITVTSDYFNFSYDYSILHDNKDVVLSATFRLIPEDPKVIQQRVDANIAWRKEKHPKGAARKSAGSVFRKLDGYGAGRLIEQVGLKGKYIGGAKISEEHANFILNENGASAKDVRDLIILIQQKVKQELGLDMQTEISFVGEF